MADETENLTLHLLREMREENAAFRTEMRSEIASLRTEVRERFDGLEQHVDRLETESRSQSETLGKVVEAVTKIANVQEQHSTILMQHSELLTEIVRVQKSHAGRLNIVDERLASLERKAGFVSA